MMLVYGNQRDVQQVCGSGWDSPGNLEFAARFWSLAEELLAQGKLKAHPVELHDGEAWMGYFLV